MKKRAERFKSESGSAPGATKTGAAAEFEAKKKVWAVGFMKSSAPSVMHQELKMNAPHAGESRAIWPKVR